VYARLNQILAPFTLFVMAGAIRVIIKHANFKNWQNLLFKMIIFADGMCYFGIGVYIMYFDFKPTKGMLPAADTSFRDFSLLFVFGSLSFYK